MRGGPSLVHLAAISEEPTFSAKTTVPNKTAEGVNLKRARSRKLALNPRRARPNSVPLHALRNNPPRAHKNNRPRVRRKDLRNVHKKHRPNVPRKERRRSRQGHSRRLGPSLKRDLRRSRKPALSPRRAHNRNLGQNPSARRLHPHSVPMAAAARQPRRAPGDMLPWDLRAEAEADRPAANDSNIEIRLE